MTLTDDGLLDVMLATAVPLWIERHVDSSSEHRVARALVCGGEIAAHGDVLVYKVKGASARAFNRLAEGLAIASFAPGGITFNGQRWTAP